MPDLRPALPFLLLAAAALAAYANAWPDTLVVDDKLFASHERFADLSSVGDFFRESAWAAAGANESLYRPLLMVSVAIDAALFGDHFAAWHLVNVFLHVLATLLVYLLLRQLLRLPVAADEPVALVALLAALVFAVHPVHAEVVNSIFNRSELLAAVGSAGGLWWLLRYLDARPALAWSGIWLAYCFVLFSRETGIVLPALAVTLVWIYTEGAFRAKARRCLPALAMAAPALVYLVVRARAVAPPLSPDAPAADDPLGVTRLVASGGLLHWDSVMHVAGVWLDALRLMVWPRPLLLHHPGPDQATQIAGLLLHLGLLAAALYLYRRRRPGLLAGLAIFYIALLPSSRLIGSDGTFPHLAERYLYLPSIGLAVLLAFGLRYLLRRGDRLLAAAPAVLALLLLTPLTWARNADWSNEVALLEHDYRNGVRGWASLRLLTAAHLLERNYDRAVEVCRANENTQRASGNVAVHCGTAYAMSGDPQRAEQAFLAAAEKRKSRTRAHSNLARLYLTQGRREDSRAQFELAVESERNPATRAYREGLMLARLYPEDRAKLLEAQTYFEEALRLQPRLELAISELEQVERKLERLPP
jgi:tetratricopeptide (TPR) repeat protein